jgi:hypothetical protein
MGILRLIALMVSGAGIYFLGSAVSGLLSKGVFAPRSLAFVWQQIDPESFSGFIAVATNDLPPIAGRAMESVLNVSAWLALLLTGVLLFGLDVLLQHRR